MHIQSIKKIFCGKGELKENISVESSSFVVGFSIHKKKKECVTFISNLMRTATVRQLRAAPVLHILWNPFLLYLKNLRLDSTLPLLAHGNMEDGVDKGRGKLREGRREKERERREREKIFFRK